MNDKQERFVNVLDIRELLHALIKKWRILLIAALVGAVVLSVLALIKGVGFVEKPKLSPEKIAAAHDAIAENEKNISILKASLPNEIQRLADWESKVAEYERTYELAQNVQAGKVDSLLITQILDIIEELTAVRNSAQEVRDQIASWNNQITRMETENQTLQAEIAETEIVKGEGNLVLSAIIGIVLGLLPVVCAVVFSWIKKQEITSSNMLKQQFGLELLGDLHEVKTVESTSKCIIDRKIEKWAQKTKGSATTPEFVAEKIQLLARKRKNVLLIGTADAQEISDTLNKMKPFFTKDFNVAAAENPLRAAETMRQLDGVDIVLVEKIGESKKKDIQALVEFLSLSDLSSLGMVTI